MDIATLAIKADTTDLKKLNTSLDEVAKKGKTTESATQKLEQSFGSLAKGVAMAGVAIGAVFVGIGVKSIAMASDLEETQGKFDVVFRGMTKEAELWSTELQKSYAMGETESKKYLSNIQDLIVPTGMARDESAKLSNEFVKMAADLGSFNNLPTEQVIMDIQSALAGGSETLTKYGINVKVAQVRQEALNMGIIEGKEELTSAQRVGVLYNIMMRDGADAVGDMARTQDSYANQLKLMKAQIANLTTDIGKVLLPIARDMVTAFNDWWEINGKIVTQDLAGWISAGASAFGTFISALTQVDNFFSFVIGEMFIGWSNFTHAIDLGTLAIKNSFFIAFDQISEKTADTIGDMVSTLEKLPIIGFDIADSLNESVEKLRESSTATEDYKKAVDKLNASHNKEITSLKAIQLELVTQEGSERKLVVAKQDVVVAVEKNILTNEELERKRRENADAEVLRMEAEKLRMEEFAIGKLEIEQDLTEKINELTLSEFDYKILKLDEEVEAMLLFAENDALLRDKINEYRLLKTAEFTEDVLAKADTIAKDNTEKTFNMAEEWAAASQSIGQSYGTYVEEALLKSFGETDSAWGGMLDSMLAKLGSVVAEMAVSWAASSIANLAGWDLEGSNKFHDGAWDLKNDELPAVLQKGEMVIPQGAASDIRKNLSDVGGGDSAAFQRIAKATSNNDPSQLSGNDGPMEGQMVSILSSTLKNAAFGLLTNGPQGAIDAVRPSIIMDALANEATRGLAPPAPFGREGYQDFFSMITKTGGVLALGGVAGLPGVEQLLGVMGQWAGDLVGDGLDDRKFEELQDAREDDLISTSEMLNFAKEGVRVGNYDTSGNSVLNGAIDSTETAYNDMVSRAKSLVTVRQNEIDDEKDDEGTVIGGDGGGGGGDGGYYGGEGGEGTGGGSAGYGPGLASGGIVNRLMVPQGDDGYAALKFGEGIVDTNTMSVLSSQIKSGAFGGEEIKQLLNEILSAVKHGSYAVAKNTKDIANTLDEFNYNGLPPERSAT